MYRFAARAALWSLILVLSSQLLFSANLRRSVGPQNVTAAAARNTAAYGKLPLSFEPNLGQTSSSVQFLAREAGYSVFLAPGGAVFSLHAAIPPQTRSKSDKLQAPSPGGAMVEMDMVGANLDAKACGADPLPGKSNYFIGQDPNQWHRDVPTFARVRYSDVYRGVDLVYYGDREGRLEHDFIVAPGADPAVIRLRTPSSDGIIKDASGNVRIPTTAGDLVLQRPTVYQTIHGRRTLVAAEMAVSGNEIHFQVGAYDKTQPLVIDPVIAFATLLGGSVYDVVSDIAADESGSVYLTGLTQSMDFPTTPGSYESALPGPALSRQTYATFVTKLNPAGTALEYSTFIGQAATPQEGRAIAIDSQGNAYIAGETGPENFPLVNAFQSKYGGGSSDVFLAKLSPAGNTLIFSTFFGGNDAEDAVGVRVDPQGNIYVAGATASSNFPVKNALQSTYKGGMDAYIAKFDPSGQTLAYSTFLGGVDEDRVNALAVDAQGEAYIAGLTVSHDFPLKNPLQSIYAYGFVAKLNTAGSALVFSTYYGDYTTLLRGIALDPAGHPVIVGNTNTPNFPVKNAFQSTIAPTTTSSVAFKMAADGSSVYYSTYIGDSDSNADTANAVAVDQYGQAYIAGNTGSLSGTNKFPDTANPFGNSALANHWYPFVITLSASGKSIPYYSIFTIGPHPTAVVWINRVAVDSKLNVYVAANSTAGPGAVTTPGAFQSATPTHQIGYVFKLVIASDLSAAITGSGTTATHGGAYTYTITATNKGPDAAVNVKIIDPLPAGTTFVSDNAGTGACTAPASGNSGTVQCAITRLGPNATYSATVTVQVNSASGATLSNTAIVKSNMQDLVPANNSATLTTKVQ